MVLQLKGAIEEVQGKKKDEKIQDKEFAEGLLVYLKQMMPDLELPPKVLYKSKAYQRQREEAKRLQELQSEEKVSPSPESKEERLKREKEAEEFIKKMSEQRKEREKKRLNDLKLQREQEEAKAE